MQTNSNHPTTPAVMLLANRVPDVKAKGTYDNKTDTWSDRSFRQIAEKKHNEDR